MQRYKAIQGNGTTVISNCPILKYDPKKGMPSTSSKGWRAVNAGCCTILDEGDFTITLTSSLFGKGANCVIAITSAGDNECTVRQFKLADDWSTQLPQINAEIEKAFFAYLKPAGWRRI